MSVLGAGEAFMMASGEEAFQISRSLRFNSADQSYLSRTPSSVGNRTTWTWSGWIKRAKLGTTQRFFGGATSTNDVGWTSLFFNNEKLIIGGYTTAFRTSYKVFRDTGAWFHLVVKYELGASAEADKIKAWHNGEEVTWETSNTAPTQGGVNDTNNHTIGAEQSPNNGSLNSYCDLYLAEVNFVDGQALAPTDFGEYDDNNVWQPKKYTGSYGTNGFRLDFSDTSNLGNDAAGSNNWTPNNLVGAVSDYVNDMTFYSASSLPFNNVGRIFDGTTDSDATIANGECWVEFNPSTPIAFTSSVKVMGAGSPSSPYNLRWQLNSNSLVNGVNSNSYVTLATGSGTINKIRGQVDAGGFNWRAIEVDGVVLTDIDGAEVDSLIDTPTNYTAGSGNNGGNYATLNPLQSGATLANGNLDATSGQNKAVFATIAVGETGKKFYWEATINDSHFQQIGIADMAVGKTSAAPGDSGSEGYIYLANGEIYHDGATTSTGNATFTTGDIIGVKYDDTTRSLSWNKNGGTFFGAVTVDDGRYYAPVFGAGGGSDEISVSVNFGQRPFAYTPPTGHVSLCTTNLADPTIADGSTAFDALLYTGDGQSSKAVTGYGFSPDFLWIKERSSSSGHGLWNTVVGSSKYLVSESDAAEYTTTTELSSIDSAGFTVGSSGMTNQNSQTYVAWAWDAGSSNTSISAGSLNSSVYDQSATWSTSGTMSGFSTSGTYDFAHLFNGVLGADTPGTANQMTSPSGGSGTWTYTINNVTEFKIRLYVPGSTHATANSIKINGSDIVQAQILDKGLSNDAWHTVTVPGITTFTSLFVEDNYWYVSNIYINGKELVDSGVTVTNVPSIASTYRANPSAGFSIVSYSGNLTANGSASVAHGLNAVPELIITKRRNGNSRWTVQHKDLADNHLLKLNSTDQSYAFNYGDLTNKTSSIFSTNWTSGLNTNGNTFIAYCFAPVEGYSAFGSYTGNGSADGPFVYTGFRPKFLLYKRTDAADTVGWILTDSERNSYNVVDDYLSPTTSSAEGTTNIVDFLSNGFKMRIGGADGNISGGNYVYLSFAEHPFKTARAR